MSTPAQPISINRRARQGCVLSRRRFGGPGVTPWPGKHHHWARNLYMGNAGMFSYSLYCEGFQHAGKPRGSVFLISSQSLTKLELTVCFPPYAPRDGPESSLPGVGLLGKAWPRGFLTHEPRSTSTTRVCGGGPFRSCCKKSGHT